ncbi:hypothetical protein T484DRAFT_1808167, partial [Baffinella frigidus]
ITRFKDRVRCDLLPKLTPKRSYLVGKALMDVMSARGGDSRVAEYAKLIVDSFPAFNRFAIELFNQKAGGVSFEEALARVRCTPARSGNDNLTKVYAAYKEVYDAEVNLIIQSAKRLKGQGEARLVASIKGLAKKLAPHKASLSGHLEDFGSLLGYVAALWTLLSSKAQEYQIEKACMRQPHSTQILGVARLLGLDEPTLANHLIQINTGEGKSIALGFTASVLSLLGYRVDVVCYSRYLSERDYKDFVGLFTALGQAENIHYSDFNELASEFLRSGAHLPDIRAAFVTFLRGQEKEQGWTQQFTSFVSNVSRFSSAGLGQQALAPRPGILLMDEVDVFFSESFYGQPYRPCQLLSDDKEGKRFDQGFKLLEFVWLNRARLPDLDSLRKHTLAKALVETYPNLAPFLVSELDRVLKAAARFPASGAPKLRGGEEDFCVDPVEHRIGYIDPATGVESYTVSYGYVTSFMYFYLAEQRKLDIRRAHQ